MSSELEYSLSKVRAACARLAESSERAVDDLDRDGVIQRFEFTFELFWKAVRAVLRYEGFECAGPRSCVKEGLRRGFLVDGELLLDMLEDRNKTSHVYDEATAREIFERIKTRYLSLLSRNIGLLTTYADSD